MGKMDVIATGLDRAAAFLERVGQLNARYRAGDIHAHVPERLRDGDESLESLVATLFPLSARALDAASNSLFYSLPVAFDPGESVGPYLAIVDRDAAGEPYRFLDMGALIATHAFGENDPAVVRAILDSLPFVTDRYAHSEYQTVLSLRLKAALDRIAPAGTPRHFVVNTGAEAVENAIKAGAHEPGDDRARRRRRVHRLVRRRVSRPHARGARRHAPEEGAPRLSDLRLAAHSVSGRCRERTQGNGAPRGSQPEAALGSAGVGPAAGRGEEQGHLPARDRRAGRVSGAARRRRARLRDGAALEPEPRRRSAARGAWRRCWSSRSRARAACA